MTTRAALWKTCRASVAPPSRGDDGALPLGFHRAPAPIHQPGATRARHRRDRFSTATRSMQPLFRQGEATSTRLASTGRAGTLLPLLEKETGGIDLFEKRAQRNREASEDLIQPGEGE